VRRVAILISGGGSNMVRLVESMTGEHPARPVLVASNDPRAGGLVRAAALGIETAAIDHRAHSDRATFEAALSDRLEAAAPDIVALAGFMRILTPAFVDRWKGRTLNIHPSLLPKYRGLDTHARALEAGDAEAGCTVHEVTAELDGGPILGQARVPVRPTDTPDRLAARVLVQEHRLYPEVLRRFAAGERTPVTMTAPPPGARPERIEAADGRETWLLPDGSERMVLRRPDGHAIVLGSGPDWRALPSARAARAALDASGVAYRATFGIDVHLASVAPEHLPRALEALSLP
jgi:phosphoribosylglycinamide formyltransferase-1